VPICCAKAISILGLGAEVYSVYREGAQDSSGKQRFAPDMTGLSRSDTLTMVAGEFSCVLR
jgi:hypothetical protein